MPTPTVADLLAEQDPIRRNEQALILAESRSAEVLEALLTLINRSDLKDQRGTLVHCLRKFAYEKQFPLLARLVVEGNWEVAHEAAGLINDITCSEGDLAEEAYALLQDSQNRDLPEKWRSELVADLLGMFV